MIHNTISRLVDNVIKHSGKKSGVVIIPDYELSSDTPPTDDEYWRACLELTKQGYKVMHDNEDESLNVIIVLYH